MGEGVFDGEEGGLGVGDLVDQVGVGLAGVEDVVQGEVEVGAQQVGALVDGGAEDGAGLV